MSVWCGRSHDASDSPERWNSALRVPDRWTLTMTVQADVLSVSIIGDRTAGALFLDLASRERLIDVTGTAATAASVRYQLLWIAWLRDADDRAAAPRVVCSASYYPDGSWSTLQQLAVAAGGIWYPPPAVAANGQRYRSLYLFRRVNRSIRLRRRKLQ